MTPLKIYEGSHARVDQLGHVLWLEVFLGLSGVHDEVAATVVPVNRSSIVTEDWLLIGLLLLLIHQVESIGEVFRFYSISLCLHFFKIIFISILVIFVLWIILIRNSAHHVVKQVHGFLNLFLQIRTILEIYDDSIILSVLFEGTGGGTRN